MKSETSKYLHSLKNAAELLEVGRTTMYELINSGKIKVTKIGPRGIRIADAELNRYIADNSEGR